MSALTLEQRRAANRLLIEQADAFATSEDGIGCIHDLKMNINLILSKTQHQYRRIMFLYLDPYTRR